MDLFDGALMRDYGWTLEYVDGLDSEKRSRLARIWATESTTRLAEQHLAQHAKANLTTMQTVERIRAKPADE